MRDTITLAFVACLAATTVACAETVVVRHGATPDPVYLDLGAEGESAGDQRLFAFDGAADEGQPVAMQFVLTTTTVGTEGTDTRMTDAVFQFTGDRAGSILVAGLGVYPSKGATVKIAATLERAVMGGTGAFAGASGTVVTTHLPDGTWEHRFDLK